MRQLETLARLARQGLCPIEVILAGEVSPFADRPDLLKLDMSAEAEAGFLGAMRNRAFEASQGEVIVFIDDDVLFPSMWLSRFIEFSRDQDWNWLGNRILSPQGDRYWDRALRKPHSLASYQHDPADPNLYQTGCFWVLKRAVCEQHLWDPTLPFYAEHKGYPENEDLDFSRRLFGAGYRLDFDPENLVWHADPNYIEHQPKGRPRVTTHLDCLDTAARQTAVRRPLHPDFAALSHSIREMES